MISAVCFTHAPSKRHFGVGTADRGEEGRSFRRSRTHRLSAPELSDGDHGGSQLRSGHPRARTVKISYVDQSRDALDPKKGVWELISGGEPTIAGGKREVNSRAYCSWFNFRGSDQQKKVGDLSGGERNRVHLAKLLKTGGNVLLLDEPTNDLDVDTLRALEAGLESFPGCVVVISHDRWFLDRIATHMLAFEGDSQVRWFEGNFSEYEAFRKKELGSAADQPHRIRYKRLTA